MSNTRRGFEKNRKIAPNCPCGKSNKDGKFAPFKGETEYGVCHSCGINFFPPNAEETNAPKPRQAQKFVDKQSFDITQGSFVGADNFFKYFRTLVEKVGKTEEEADRHLLRMGVGTGGSYTIFWDIDIHGRVCQPKNIPYSRSGNRIKDGAGIVPEKTFNQANEYYPCLFGEHQLVDDSRDVIVVEAEKSAVIASFFFPQYIWVSGGGANGLSFDKAMNLKDRNVVILYDSDEAGRTNAPKAQENAEKAGAKAMVFDMFPELIDGYDIADAIEDKCQDDTFMNVMIVERLDKCFRELELGGNIDELEEGILHVDIDEIVYSYVNDIRDRGETSHFYELDYAFKWKKGFVYSYTGHAGTGKSEINLFLAFMKAYVDNWRFIVYAPENLSSNEEGMMTAYEMYDSLVHTYWGKEVDINGVGAVTEQEYREAAIWIKAHFTFIFPKKGICKQEDIIRQAEYVIKTNKGEKFNALILDPWNTVRTDQQKNELIDDYLRRMINDAKLFAVRNRMCWVYVTHPSKVARSGKDGEIPSLHENDIRGGNTFANGSDFVIVINRPYFFKDVIEDEQYGVIQGKNHPLVEFITRKVKNQKLLGCRPNAIQLYFDKKKNRYNNEFGFSPLDEAYRKQHSKDKDDDVEAFEQSSLNFVAEPIEFDTLNDRMVVAEEKEAEEDGDFFDRYEELNDDDEAPF